MGVSGDNGLIGDFRTREERASLEGRVGGGYFAQRRTGTALGGQARQALVDIGPGGTRCGRAHLGPWQGYDIALARRAGVRGGVRIEMRPLIASPPPEHAPEP